MLVAWFGFMAKDGEGLGGCEEEGDQGHIQVGVGGAVYQSPVDCAYRAR